MQRLRHKLLSCPSGTCHQQGSEVRRDSSYFGKNVEHEGAASHHTFKLAGIQQCPVEPQGLLTVLRVGNKTSYPAAKLLDVERFGPVIASALLNRFDRRFWRIVARNQNHVRSRINCDDALQQLHPTNLGHD